MNKKKASTIFLWCLIAVNTILCFWVMGMPHDEICKYHFTDFVILDHQEVTLKADTVALVKDDESGATVTLPAGTSYSHRQVNFDGTLVIYVSGDFSKQYIIKTSDLIPADEQKMNDYIAQTQSAKENGAVKYADYKYKLDHWYLEPEYFIVGLIPAVVFALINVLIAKREKLQVYLIMFNLLVLPILILGIYHFTFNRPVCK